MSFEPMLEQEESKQPTASRLRPSALQNTVCMYKLGKPGEGLHEGKVVVPAPLRLEEYPGAPLDDSQQRKRFQVEDKPAWLSSLQTWKQRDLKGFRRKKYIQEVQKVNEKVLQVAEKGALEQLEVYSDRFPLLKLRVALLKFILRVHVLANAVITSKLFETLSITIIMANCAVMVADDPIESNAFFETAENAFLILYSIEMGLKIMGMGFIFGEKAYLKDSWNILDFIIVISSYPQLFAGQAAASTQGSEFSLGSLRTFRVLRPLKTISNIRGLKVLMTALFSAMPLLKDTLIILQFFFITFAIAGSLLFSGSLKNRCISVQFGGVEDELLCSSDGDCPGGYFCGKSNNNPNYGSTNFDNVCYSLLCVFQCVTLEGWSDIQR